MSAADVTPRTPGQILMESTVYGSKWSRQTDATRAKWERHADEVYGTIAEETRKVLIERDTLRARLTEWESRLSEVMPAEYKDWHENAREEWPTVAALTIRNLREREDESGRQIDTLRAEVEALREEVRLTNEHEHQILQERNEARAEVQRLRDELAARDAVGVPMLPDLTDIDAKHLSIDNVVPVSAVHLIWREAQAYLRSRLSRPAPSQDVVTVPREEMERRTWRDFAAGWSGARRSTPRQSSDEEAAVRDQLASAWIDALNGIDALRSAHPATNQKESNDA